MFDEIFIKEMSSIDAYNYGRQEAEKELNALGECEYNKGAKDFAEWLLHQDKVLYSSVSNVFFTYDYEHSIVSILSIDEVLAEWQKGKDNEIK